MWCAMYSKRCQPSGIASPITVHGILNYSRVAHHILEGDAEPGPFMTPLFNLLRSSPSIDLDIFFR